MKTFLNPRRQILSHLNFFQLSRWEISTSNEATHAITNEKNAQLLRRFTSLIINSTSECVQSLTVKKWLRKFKREIWWRLFQAHKKCRWSYWGRTCHGIMSLCLCGEFSNKSQTPFITWALFLKKISLKIAPNHETDQHRQVFPAWFLWVKLQSASRSKSLLIARVISEKCFLLNFRIAWR